MATLLIAALFVLFLSLALGVTCTLGGSVQGEASGTTTITVSDNELVKASPVTVPKAQPGTLSTRTSGTVGVLTMTNADHGIITGQRLDLYWPAQTSPSQAAGRTYKVTVGTVAGTSVPITLSTGTLPVLNSAAVAGIATQVPFNVTGDNLTLLLLTNPQEAQFTFDSSAPAVLLNVYLPANQGYAWATGFVGANPLAGAAVASVWMSHSYTTGALTPVNGQGGLQAAALTH